MEGIKEALMGGLYGPRDALATAKTVGILAVAWTSLELFSYILIRPYFMRLLEGNPAMADPKKRNSTATQMLPRVVCFLHNLIQVPLGLVILTSPVFYSGDARTFAATPYSTLVMAISAGYFAYDTLECIARYEHEGPDFLFHGVFCFITFASLAYLKCLHWFGAGFLMWELSTPFLHFRWFLFKIAKDKGTLYVANGLAGLVVFFLCRICWGPIVSAIYWKDSWALLSGPRASELPFGWMMLYRFCTGAMNGLNIWWFEKMVRIALDAAKGKGSKTKKSGAAAPAAQVPATVKPLKAA